MRIIDTTYHKAQFKVGDVVYAIDDNDEALPMIVNDVKWSKKYSCFTYDYEVKQTGQKFPKCSANNTLSKREYLMKRIITGGKGK